MNSHMIFECENCNNIKILVVSEYLKKAKCDCNNPITRLYGLFKDGKVCRIHLKGVSKL